jgi:hypothetical protein
MDYIVYVPNREDFDHGPDGPQILPSARYFDLNANTAILHGFRYAAVPRRQTSPGSATNRYTATKNRRV